MAPIVGVQLSADVFMVCLNHALVTEKEEVMGLLIGEIDEERISHISAVITLRRSDKRKDRVEISPEQLSDASTQAETSADYETPNESDRLVSFSPAYYCVAFAHVQTQKMYQMMDDGFVGVIFSVFNNDKTTNQGRIELTCFQSSSSDPPNRVEIPIYIVPTTEISRTCLDVMSQLPSILCDEEIAAHTSANESEEKSVLKVVYNQAVFTKALCHISEIASLPLAQMLENRLQRNKLKVQKLYHEKQKLIGMSQH